MTTLPIPLQDLRKRIYLKAKAEPDWRFWGLYVHVCKMETLREAYRMAKANNGAPGIDGLRFEAIEKGGLDEFLEGIRAELVAETYWPQRNRQREIPKGNGKTRTLGIPTIRDRVVQGALKLILEPIFEADFQEGSYGYRPKRTPHQAVQQVATAIVSCKTRVIDVDLASYFDTIRHDILLRKVAERVNDDKVMHLLKLVLKAGGKRGVPQGGVISPILSNIYLNEVDKMLEKAKDVTREGKYTHLEYARFADDAVVLVDSHPKWDWLYNGAIQRLKEELAKLDVKLNIEKTKYLDLAKGDNFGFLGFDFRRVKTHRGVWGVRYAPKMAARTKLLHNVKDVFQRFRSQPVGRVVELINPILRGWVAYYKVGHSSITFGFVKDWVEKKVRRHLMQARGRQGFGWIRWSRQWLYDELRLFNGYRVASRC